MIILLLALLIGVVAGRRTFTAPAAISWAAHEDAVAILTAIVTVMVAR
jgi:uncharacterized membrane protein